MPHWVAWFTNRVAHDTNTCAHSRVVDAFKHPDLLENGTKVIIGMLGLNEPTSVCIANGSVEYRLKSPHTYTHRIRIDCEVVYFNGTTYNKVVQPALFVLGPDSNNDFDRAEELTLGTHYAYCDGRAEGDPIDYYKIWLSQGQTVSIGLSGTDGNVAFVTGMDLDIYTPDRQLETSLHYKPDAPEQVVVNASTSGW